MALSKPSSKEQLAKFEIKELIELEGGKCSGSGSFGTVFKVKVGGVTRIAKRLHNVLTEHDIRPEDKAGIRERFCTECLLLSKLDHPCIVQFVGVHFHGINRVDVTLVMECLHTDLDRFLDPKERPNIPLSIKLSILLDVSAGLLYLHHQLEEPLVHRDLKPENILITNDVRAKIADLGVSKLLKNYPHQAAVQTKCPGTLAYMPPEALCENPQYGTSLDIFSFGQLALYTAIQQFPQVFNMILDPKMTSAIRLRKSEILKRNKWIDLLGEHHCLYKIILQCLKDDSANRPKTQELKNAMNTLCVIHPKSLVDVASIMEDEADAVELKRKNAQLTSDNVHLEQALASKVNDIQALKLELEKIGRLIMEKKELQDQVEALQLQVMAYKADFEEERRDREAAHSKMANMEKTIARLKDRSGREKAEFELEFATKDLEKHKKKFLDLETVYSRHVQEAGKQIQELTSQVSQAKSELQAKVSQVKQYAKENEKVKGKNEQLKLQLSTAMTSLGVMAEEMDKDRRKAFELQGKLDKFRKGATAKEKTVHITGPDACEATGKRIAKLEELYDTAVIDVQSLTVEKEELTKQVGELLQEKRVCPLQHGSSQSTATPAMRQRPFIPKRTAKNPPTDQAYGASAYSDVSPMRNSGPYPSLGGGPSSITSPPNSDAQRILTPYKCAPLLQFNTPHNHDDGNTDQSNLNRISGPFKRTPAVPEVVTTPPSGPPDGYPQPTTPVSPGADSSSQVLTKPDRQDYVHSQPSSLPLRDAQYDLLKDNSPSPSGKPYIHPRVKVTMSPSVEIPDKVTTPSASEMKPTSDDEGLEEEQEVLNRSANQFENPLQRKLDDEIHEHAVKVMREVSGKRLEESGDESGRPFDPNLICPMCMKKFRIGEIQYFKRHVNTCDGTDGDDWV